MKNAKDIWNASLHLAKAAEQIASYAMDISHEDEISDGLADLYEELVLDQISQAQILMLRLTDLVTEGQETNADEDGGVFAEGELTSVLGSKEPDDSGKEV